MATESEAGSKLPPGVGILTKDVVKTRPDLSDMEGFTVRVPRSLDVESNDGPQRVWVQGPMDEVVLGVDYDPRKDTCLKAFIRLLAAHGMAGDSANVQ